MASSEEPLRKGLLKEIELVVAHLVEAGLADAQKYSFLLDRPEEGWSLSQSGASLSLALKKRPYEDIYLELIGAEAYTALLLDGAILQFSYEGVGEEILRHRLAYLPSPTLLPYQSDPELYVYDYQFSEVVGHQVVPVPIRFDFDSREGVFKNVVHPKSHVTLGQYQHCRIPTARPISPREFAEFILNNFYSTPEIERVSFKQHVRFLERTITPDEERGIHLSLC